MAISANIGLALGRVVVPKNVEELETLLGPRAKLVVVGSALGGRVSHSEQKLGQQVPLLGIHQASLALVVGRIILLQLHGRGQTAVDQVTGGADRVVRIGVWLHRLAETGAVDTSIRITRNSVPVEGRRIAQASHRHGGTRHNLVASRNDRSLQDPKQLIGMSVRVTTGAGKRLGA